MKLSRWGQIWTFMMTFLGYSTLHAMRTSWSYSKKLLQHEDQGVFITNRDLGLVDMTFMLCYSFGLTFIGPLGDRFNRRYFIAIGYYVCGLAYLVFPTCFYFFQINSLWILILFMGINGLGQSVGMPGSMGVLSNWLTGQKRGMIVGLWAGCCNYGNIFGLISSTIIVQYLELRWPFIFFFNGILTLCMATVIIVFLRDKPEKSDDMKSSWHQQLLEKCKENVEKPKEKITFFKCFKIPRVIPYVISYSCLKASIYGLLFWLPKYISEKGMSSYSGYIPSMMDCGTFTGGVLIGYLGDRFKKRSLFLTPMIFISMLMMLIAKFVLSDQPVPYFFVIFLMGFGLGGPYNIIGTVISIDLGSVEALKGNTEAISTVTAVIDGCGALFSAATQLLLAEISYEWIFALFAVYTCAAGFALIPLTVRDFKDWKIEQKQEQAQS